MISLAKQALKNITTALSRDTWRQCSFKDAKECLQSKQQNDRNTGYSLKLTIDAVSNYFYTRLARGLRRSAARSYWPGDGSANG